MTLVNQDDTNIRSSDRRAVKLERMLETASPSSPSGISPTSDPYSANLNHKLSLSREPAFCYGRVIGGGGYTRSYRVQLDRFGGVITCCDLAHSSYSIFGTRQLNTYLPGTAVWVLWPPHAMHGVILGAVPDWMIAARDALSDIIVQGSNIGLTADAVHNYPFELDMNGGIVDWSSGQPIDSIPIGDYGAVTDTGNALFMDSMLAMLRIDEETGLFLFYDDQLARLAGHNLQIWAAGYERSAKDDCNEFDDEQGFTHNAFREGKGAWDDVTTQFRAYSAQAAQQNTPYYSAFEPEVDDQQSIYRYRIFRGYLGQGEKRSLFIPPAGASGLERYQNKSKYPCVAEEFWGMDGSILIQSAKSVVIAKRALRPSPKRIRMPEDVTGDTPANYKACGVYGTGVSHKIGDFAVPGSDANLIRAAAFQDYYAKLAIHDSNVGMRYHSLDWYIPNEHDYAEASQMVNGVPVASTLRTQQYLNAPTPIQWKVDDRFGSVNYYPNDAYLTFTEDGGIELCDGYGFELRTVGGSAFMTMPGDMHIWTGKDYYVMAGRNIAERANDSVSISANFRDVRIKAENNVMIVGGNNHCGGVLIESKSPAVAFKLGATDEVIGGIILRAKETGIVLYGQQIDLILSDNGSSTGTETRSIILDAGTAGTINTRSSSFFRHVSNSIQDDIAGTVNEYWSVTATINSPLNINGNCFVNGCLDVRDSSTIGQFVDAQGFGYATTAGLQQLANTATSINQRVNVLQTWATASIGDVTTLQTNTDVLKLQFFFKASADLGTSSFKLYETRWQQIARVAGTTISTWTENPVLPETAFPGLITYPPPGKSAWFDTTSYFQQNLNLFQLNTNLSQNWSSIYENPVYATPISIKLDGNFPIIQNPS